MVHIDSLVCETLLTKDVMRLTGLSRRQLQHWDEQGYAPCRRIVGHRRRWSCAEVRLLMIVKALRAKRIQPKRAAEIARFVVAAPDSEARWAIVGAGGWMIAADDAAALRVLAEIKQPAVLVRMPAVQEGTPGATEPRETDPSQGRPGAS